MSRLMLVFLLLVSCAVSAQESAVTLRPNRGQWHANIDYLVGLQGGNMYLEQTGFTYFFYQFDGHDHNGTSHEEEAEEMKGYCVKSVFLGAQKSTSITESKPQGYYRNYFLGSDQNNWKSKIHDLQEVKYPDKYPNIDLLFSTEGEQAKYSWIVLPGGNFREIQWKYDGAIKTEVLPSGELRVDHGLGHFIEGKPIAWKLKNGRKVPLTVSYQLNENTFSFDLNGSYTDSDTVVIDPSITFSSFTGSLSDNWGFTAAPDPDGNLYAGGIVFGGGYPVTTGVVGQTFNGGTPTDGAPPTSPLSNGFDVGITKFNSRGTAFIFSTYIGGSANETPHSIVSDAQGNMFLFGVTSSPNFPTSTLCYQNSFNGGSTVSPDNLKFNGSDIYVLELNPTGTSLIASTYLGGSGNDGMSFGTLQYNYGDNFRGEIIVDQNFVYFSSVTQSADFPTLSPSQATLSGSQDAVVVKMTKNLATLVWSTYYGGSSDETGNGIALSGNGNLYVTGGTNSSNLNLGTGGWDASYNSGRDGFVTRFDATSGAVLNGTYIGTTDYDQSYFVQVDDDNDVYVLGQTAGNWAITNGRYGNPNSGQFIMKFNPALTTQQWVTTVGAGSGDIEISPTAFLVSNCKDIYLSGWGGTVNFQNSQAVTSSSNNFPVSSDAFQPTTNGSNFWIAVLGENASTLKYATYIGGSSSSFNHVDGGTSRFDKNGNIYHAVCGACAGNNFGFTTTPGVIGPENLSVNCNLAAFKFELNTIDAVVATPDPLVCLPDPIIFNNNSANGNQFEWSFGDGQTSNLVNPSHVYSGPGQYTVTLVVRDTNQCFSPDTVQFVVNIGDFNGGIVNPLAETCSNVPFQMEAFGGSVYRWEPAALFNNPNIFNPLVTSTQDAQIYCIISDSCGIDTVFAQVVILSGSLTVSNDTAICIGNTVNLFANGAAQITWSPSTYLDNPGSMTPVSTPLQSITYTASGTSSDGCALTGTVHIHVDTSLPDPVMPDSLVYCFGSSGSVTVSGATSYSWSPQTDINPATGPVVTISTPNDQYYYCDFTNACGTARDSIFVKINIPNIQAGNDTTICPGEIATVHASGGVSYVWSPSPYGFLHSDGSLVLVKPSVSTTYLVVGTDQYGCKDTASVRVSLFPAPFVQTNPDVYAVFGEEVQLNAVSHTAVSYVWSPAEYLSCNVCQSPFTQIDRPMTFTVTVYDINGCSASDQVHVYYEAIIYVPNTFTPDNNGTNETFFALGVNIRDFKLEIFNRWGESVYRGDALSQMWNGTYEGKPSPDGVYTWKIEYGEILTGERHQLVGHVNLLR
ncbi:PKD domain protein [compost metagenome]